MKLSREKALERDRLSRCVRRATFAVATSLLLGCPAAGVTSGTQTPDGTAKTVKVERVAARPSLTLVERAGDPLIALSLAMHTAGDAIDNALLAGLIEQRVRSKVAATAQLHVVSDGAGVRAVLQLLPEQPLEPLLHALVDALMEPLAAAEPLLASQQRVDALYQHPLDHRALLPLARCSGSSQILAPKKAEPPAKLRQRLRLSLASLRLQNLALALVGPKPKGAEMTAAVKELPRWPAPGDALPRRPHQAVATTYPHGELRDRLDIAAWLGDARQAAAFAQRGDMLARKLAVVAPTLKMDGLGASALDHGGCVHLRLRQTSGQPANTAAAQAAASLMRAEIAMGASEPPREDTRAIADAGRAAEVAERAAWWALTRPQPDAAPVFMSAWGVSSDTGELPASLAQSYRAAFATPAATKTRAEASSAVAIEAGQPRVWVLLANPCATARESQLNAGMAALAALALNDGSPASDITLSPYLGTAGIGVIASGPAADAHASATWLARRVGSAAARALMSPVHSNTALQRRWQGLRERVDGNAQRKLARALLPTNPSQLLPWAGQRPLLPQGAQLSHAWRDLARGPLRIAVLAPNELQGGEAIAAAHQWLLPPSIESGCDAAAPAAQPAPSVAPEGAFHHWLLGTRVDPKRRHWAALAALLLAPNSAAAASLAEQLDAEAVGEGNASALVLKLETSAATSAKQLQLRLARVRAQKLVGTQLERAKQQLARKRLLQHASPESRLATLWRGAEATPTEDVDLEAFQSWFQALFDSKRWVFVPRR